MNSDAFRHALDALSVLQEAGLVVAPLVPSPFMISVGQKVKNLDADTVREIYEVMVMAAQAPENREPALDQDLKKSAN